jgi:hypothetical protein
MKTTIDSSRGVPNLFVARFQPLFSGILSGFDRLFFQGCLRPLQRAEGMRAYLNRAHVLLKDFTCFAESLTDRVRVQAQALAASAGLKVEYLRSCRERKQLLAEQAAAARQIKEGLVSVYSCVEPCRTFFVRGDQARKQLVLEAGAGKCLHLYFYFRHPTYGLIHLRLQTWFPFTVTVCLNGRQWLAQQLQREQIAFVQQGNCFTQIADLARAQALSDAQLETAWAPMLEGLLAECHPLAREITAPLGQSYYWTLKESEYATDVLFHSPEELGALYPRLVHHGIEHFGSEDVLRFLGQAKPGAVHGLFQAELQSSLRRRPEGVRIKHVASGNSLKCYDKAGQVLRVETTINHPEFFKVYRPIKEPKEPQPGQPQEWGWAKMRRSVADIHRRADISRAANRRYLDALAQASNQEPVGPIAETIFAPVKKNGRRFRALNPWTAADGALLEAISDGKWTINGLRNGDLREALFGASADPVERRRLAARTTRLLGLLRAHGILQKIAHTHRYQVTAKGRQIITALQAARRASIEGLAKMAA